MGTRDAVDEAPEGLTALIEASRFDGAADGITSSNTEHAIDLHGVQLQVQNRVLLEDAHVQLRRGVRYGLIGRNGVGKSMMMQSIAYRWLPGITRDLSIFYVDQLEREWQLDMSLVDLMLSTHTDSWRAWSWIQRLGEALEQGDSVEAGHALLEYERDCCQRELVGSRRRAAAASGKRGLTARKEVVALEHKLDGMDEHSVSSMGQTAVRDAIERHLKELYEVAEDRSELSAQAQETLKTFGFDERVVDMPLRTQSGGWRIRVALAMAKFVDADVLLLDEPTNHLDLPGIMWLRNYISELPDDVTLVVVSHDRGFLNDCVESIVLMQAHKLRIFPGNYEAFVEALDDEKAHRSRTREALNKKKATAADSIRRDAVQAARRNDPKKQAQVASRKKKLEERTGVERNAKGHRFKLNRDRAGHHHTVRDDVEDEHVERPLHWRIDSAGALRAPGHIFVVDNVTFRYAGAPRSVLRQVSFSVDQNERVAIIGANGQGKSTLMHLLSGRLSPSRGTVSSHSRADVAYFEQHFVDAAREVDRSVINYLESRFPGESQQTLFNAIGIFDLARHANQEVRSMSGGQIVRLALATLHLRRPHVLLLDEPTNHLDLEAIEALQDCVMEFEGTVVLISHDVHFIRALECSKVLDVVGGSVTDIHSVDDYRIPRRRDK